MAFGLFIGLRHYVPQCEVHSDCCFGYVFLWFDDLGLFATQEWISYESHFFGAISGGVAGYFYARRDKRRSE